MDNAQTRNCQVASVTCSVHVLGCEKPGKSKRSNGNNEESGVHQGSVLSPLLFIIVLEALSREFRSGRMLLYADDLIVSAECMEELLVTVQAWKSEMEKKGLRVTVNIGKTKILVSGNNLDLRKKSRKDP